jgi:hypothetical protein
MKLDAGQLHLMRLTQKDAQPDGWAKVSQAIWPFATKLPDDLVEKRPSGDAGHIRLTEGGKAIVRYS